MEIIQFAGIDWKHGTSAIQDFFETKIDGIQFIVSKNTHPLNLGDYPRGWFAMYVDRKGNWCPLNTRMTHLDGTIECDPFFEYTDDADADIPKCLMFAIATMGIRCATEKQNEI